MCVNASDCGVFAVGVDGRCVRLTSTRRSGDVDVCVFRAIRLLRHAANEVDRFRGFEKVGRVKVEQWVRRSGVASSGGESSRSLEAVARGVEVELGAELLDAEPRTLYGLLVVLSGDQEEAISGDAEQGERRLNAALDEM